MVNVGFLALALTAVLTGLAVSVIAAALVRLVRLACWRLPADDGAGFRPFTLFDWLSATVTGPDFLLRAAWEARREGEVSPSLFALAAVAAAGWGGLIGLFLFQLASWFGFIPA